LEKVSLPLYSVYLVVLGVYQVVPGCFPWWLVVLSLVVAVLSLEALGALAGGAFLGLCGGFGGGGGTLSAMAILYWQPGGLFERIGRYGIFFLS
jgi:hypothetical protein